MAGQSAGRDGTTGTSPGSCRQLDASANTVCASTVRGTAAMKAACTVQQQANAHQHLSHRNTQKAARSQARLSRKRNVRRQCGRVLTAWLRPRAQTASPSAWPPLQPAPPSTSSDCRHNRAWWGIAQQGQQAQHVSKWQSGAGDRVPVPTASLSATGMEGFRTLGKLPAAPFAPAGYRPAGA